jgi:CubicO group peptidase (beta-lactamase class C family)
VKRTLITRPSRRPARTAALLLLLVLAGLVVLTSPPAAAAPDTSTVRQPASTDAIVADLQAYIPVQLEVVDVPGVSIALMHAGEIVWEAGFGVSNTRSREPVTKDGVFEVASLSKPVAAYAALTLVHSGALELDEPVYRLFERPWLPRSDWGDQITLRELLAHTSGLSKRLHPLDRSIDFSPGERYAYSNVGYRYLQAVMEQVTGSTLESVARAAVFEPLGMTSSTFADDPEVISRLVSGHVDYGTSLGTLLATLLATLAICFAAVLATGLAIQGLRKKRVAVTWRLVAILYPITAVASLPVLAWLDGGFTKWWVLNLIVIAIFSVWAVAWTAASRLYIRRYSEPWRSGVRLWLLRVLSLLSCLAVFTVAANVISGPVPKEPLETPCAANSLKTTAGDLARFMIEVADPEHLDPRVAAEMVTPQVEVDGSNSYGLGLFICSGSDNYWLWHSGDNTDFQALMVMCPATGDGVVVLANGQHGAELNGAVARRALGVSFVWGGK